ncbi:hypothetical protein [Paraburkholderia sp. BR13444]|uniref:hypothetical protein n=1 Tax=Paraburkholderia sp. BR13444 TaxID=3236997 RepID=UPI0034CD14D2
MQFRNFHVAPLALVFLLLLSACRFTNKSEPGSEAEAPVTVGQVQSALDQKNFGLAAALSDKLTAASPTNADAWLIAADAKAASDSRIGALVALESALNNGMRDVARLDADHYLGPLRSSNEYQALLARFGLARPVVQAGDSSITETSAGTVVRAGDISVTLPNTK